MSKEPVREQDFTMQNGCTNTGLKIDPVPKDLPLNYKMREHRQVRSTEKWWDTIDQHDRQWAQHTSWLTIGKVHVDTGAMGIIGKSNC